MPPPAPQLERLTCVQMWPERPRDGRRGRGAGPAGRAAVAPPSRGRSPRPRPQLWAGCSERAQPQGRGAAPREAAGGEAGRGARCLRSHAGPHRPQSLVGSTCLFPSPSFYKSAVAFLGIPSGLRGKVEGERAGLEEKKQNRLLAGSPQRPRPGQRPGQRQARRVPEAPLPRLPSAFRGARRGCVHPAHPLFPFLLFRESLALSFEA